MFHKRETERERAKWEVYKTRKNEKEDTEEPYGKRVITSAEHEIWVTFGHEYSFIMIF